VTPIGSESAVLEAADEIRTLPAFVAMLDAASVSQSLDAQLGPWLAEQAAQRLPTEAERSEACEIILAGAVASRVAARARSQSSRLQRRRVLERYPYPIAASYSRAISADVGAPGRYMGVLDAFENSLVFLGHVQLAAYLSASDRDDALDRYLYETLVARSRISTGTRVELLVRLTQSLARTETADPFGLDRVLLTETGQRSEATRLLFHFSHLRNRNLGHNTERSSQFFERELPRDTELLERLLAALCILEGAELVVPTSVHGSRLSEGKLYLGALPPTVEALDVHLRAEDAPGAGGAVHPYRSLLLLLPERAPLCLYPLYMHKDVARREERGLYFLSEMRWVENEGATELRRVTFQAHGAVTPAPDGSHIDERLALESLFRRRGIVGSGTPASSDAVSAMFGPAALERARKLRHFVGREKELEDIEERIVRLAPFGGTIVVSGPPGIGKSTLLARVSVAAARRLYHSIHTTADHVVLLRSLIAQSEACGVPVNRSVVADEPNRLRSEWEDALVRTDGGAEPLVVVVDGLDELDHSRGTEAALGWFPRTAIPGVVFVLGSRPNVAVSVELKRRAGESRCDEIPLGGISLDEVAEFISGAASPAVRDVVLGVVDVEQVKRVIGGHPLLLRQVALEAERELEVAAASGRPPNVVSLSSGTQHSFLERLWERVTAQGDADPEGRRLRRRALELLAVAAPPGMSISLLHHAVEVSLGQALDREDVRAALADLGEMTLESGGRYRLFHGLLAEFVLSNRLSPREVQRRHGELTSALVRSGAEEDHLYWTQNTTHHAVLAGTGLEELRTTLCAPAFLRSIGHGRRGHAVGCQIAQLCAHDVESAALGDLVQAVDSSLQEDLTLAEKGELVRMLIEAANGLLAEGAAGALRRLFDETGDPSYLVTLASVSFQQLDDWQGARATLESALKLSEEADAGWRRDAVRSYAALLFDLGVDEPSPEGLLEGLAVADASGPIEQSRQALVLETMGVVVDAEARWEEARAHFQAARRLHGSVGHRLGELRVMVNETVAILFTHGPEAAWEHSNHVAVSIDELESAPAQLRQYHLTNRAMLALTLGDLAAMDEIRSRLVVDELWLELTMQETAAIREWFGGNPDQAIALLEDARPWFDKIGDAWATSDYHINMGFIRLDLGDPDEARRHLEHAFRLSDEQEYALGRVLAGEGLQRLGADVELSTSDRVLLERHVRPALSRAPSFHSPAYVQLVVTAL
jgi:tetratricopeptide (TPR) repeat protein